MPRFTKVKELETKDDEYLECYDFGHSWSRLGYFHWNSRNGICRKYFCTRCTTIREDYFTRKTIKSAWNFFDRRYTYPDGYLKKGTGRVSKQDIHNEVLRRVISSNEILPDDEWATRPQVLSGR